jgi:hypothetical protein
MIRHKRRHADTEVDVEAIAQFVRNALYDALALFNVFRDFWWTGHKCSGRWPVVSGQWFVNRVLGFVSGHRFSDAVQSQ